MTSVVLPCGAGWNSLMLRCCKRTSGFGCHLEPELSVWNWIPFLTPFAEREGQGGLVYSQPFDGPRVNVPDIDLNGNEADTGLCWYPAQTRETMESPGDLEAVFGRRPGKWPVYGVKSDRICRENRRLPLPVLALNFIWMEDGSSPVTLQ